MAVAVAVDEREPDDAPVQAALAETDRVRTNCRTHMLEHFYQVAAVMPEQERPRYLAMVLPLIEHPEQMGAYNVSRRGH